MDKNQNIELYLIIYMFLKLNLVDPLKFYSKSNIYITNINIISLLYIPLFIILHIYIYTYT